MAHATADVQRLKSLYETHTWLIDGRSLLFLFALHLSIYSRKKPNFFLSLSLYIHIKQTNKLLFFLNKPFKNTPFKTHLPFIQRPSGSCTRRTPGDAHSGNLSSLGHVFLLQDMGLKLFL